MATEGVARRVPSRLNESESNHEIGLRRRRNLLVSFDDEIPERLSQIPPVVPLPIPPPVISPARVTARPIYRRRRSVDENQTAPFSRGPWIPAPIQDNNENVRLRRHASTLRGAVDVASIDQKILCLVCYLEKESREFIDQYCQRCSRRRRTVCDECVQDSIVTTLNFSFQEKIICPEERCYNEISSDVVLKILLKINKNDLFNRYENHLTRKYFDTQGDFRWCAHGCGFGQFYSRDSHPKMMCFNCKKLTCSVHQVPWHENNDCENYQKQIERVDPQTQNYLEKKTKSCPKCHSNIEKNQGCDHMTCSKCRAQFCWECLVLYRPHDTTYTARHLPTCSNSYATERLLLPPNYPRWNRPSLPRRIIRSVVPNSISCVIL